MAQLESDSLLPALRRDIRIQPGIRELDGSKTWTLFDPLRHQYFQIDNKNLQILKCWNDCNAGAIVTQLQEHDVTLDDIEALLRFLWKHALTETPPNDDLDYLMRQAASKHRGLVKGALHSYLFFRLHLLHPSHFLKQTEPFTRVFFSRGWWLFVAACAVVGLFLTSRQWDQFTHTFSHFFSVQGLFFYAVALIFVKCLHELGHGYAATRYGCRITSMGVAFIVCFPVLFTDTTDSWRLTSKRQRLIISGAGVAVELSIAAIATLLWAFLGDGPLRSAAFFVATTSWTMSLLVNLNPFMRFDAYHFLSDALGVQNLQARSFALGRWRLREVLFGLGDAPPEAMSTALRRGLTTFAWLTWVYRFFLFVGIALLIHSFLYKPFGALLAGVELLFFIAIPIMSEINQWWVNRAKIVASPSSWITGVALAGLLAVFIVPWQATIRMPAVIEAAQQVPLYAPEAAQIAEIHVAAGDQVEQGDIIFTLQSAELDNQIIAAERRIDLVQALLGRIAADAQDRDHKLVLETELQQWREELQGLQVQQQQLSITAPFRGVVVELDRNLHAGRWISDNIKLGTLVSNAGSRIRGYLSATDLGRIGSGGDAVFIPDLPEQQRTSGAISIVETTNAEHLTIADLTSHYDGPIAVSRVEEQLVPLKSWYQISMDMHAEHPSVSTVMRGTLLAQGEPESLMKRFWRRAVHVVLREVVI